MWAVNKWVGEFKVNNYASKNFFREWTDSRQKNWNTESDSTTEVLINVYILTVQIYIKDLLKLMDYVNEDFCLHQLFPLVLKRENNFDEHKKHEIIKNPCIVIDLKICSLCGLKKSLP